MTSCLHDFQVMDKILGTDREDTKKRQQNKLLLLRCKLVVNPDWSKTSGGLWTIFLSFFQFIMARFSHFQRPPCPQDRPPEEEKLPGIRYCMLIASSLSLSPRRQIAAPENNMAATKDHPTPTHASMQLQSQLILVLSRSTYGTQLYYTWHYVLDVVHLFAVLFGRQTAGTEEEQQGAGQ